MELIQLEDVFNATKERRYSLVNLCGLYRKNPPRPGRCSASGFFHDHCHRTALIQQPKLSVGIASCCRITINASVDQHVVDVGDESPYITSTGPCFDRAWAGSLLKRCEIVLHGVGKVAEVGLIERIDRTRLWNSNIFVRVKEYTLVGIESEAVDPRSHRHHEDGRRRIETIPSGNKTRITRLHEGGLAGIRSRCRLVDTKHGSHWERRINVLTAINGIEYRHIIANRKGRVVLYVHAHPSNDHHAMKVWY